MADETPPQDAATPPVDGETPPVKDEDNGPKGNEKAVLADLARERKERQRLAKELEQVRTANLSEAEKAVAEAEKRGEQAALTRVGHRLVDAELRVATVGRALTTDALLTFDRSSFLTDEGEVDRDGLRAWVDQNSLAAGPPPAPSFDGGARSTPAPAVDMNARLRQATGRA